MYDEERLACTQYVSKEIVFPKVFRALTSDPCFQDAGWLHLKGLTELLEGLLSLPSFAIFHVYCHPGSYNWNDIAREHPDWRIVKL